MNNMLNIIKSKLARGGQMNAGELKLVLRDYINVIESMQEKLNELEDKIDAVSRRGGGRPKKSDSSTEVRSEQDK